MSARQHSPAPWSWVNYGDFYRLVDSKGERVADDGSAAGEYPATIDVKGPDALLIAAAPTLLVTLKTLVRRIERDNLHTTCGVQLTEARAAIAKAEGKAP